MNRNPGGDTEKASAAAIGLGRGLGFVFEFLVYTVLSPRALEGRWVGNGQKCPLHQW